MTAPDRITAWGDKTNLGIVYKAGPCPMDGMSLFAATEYVRADLARAPLAEALAVPEVAALVDAAETLLNRCTDEDLVAKALMRNLRTKIAALRAIGEPRNG